MIKVMMDIVRHKPIANYPKSHPSKGGVIPPWDRKNWYIYVPIAEVHEETHFQTRTEAYQMYVSCFNNRKSLPRLPVGYFWEICMFVESETSGRTITDKTFQFPMLQLA